MTRAACSRVVVRVPPPPRLPGWLTGPDDPWLTRRMRDIVAIEAGERQMLDAASKAIAMFLDAARVALLGETGAHDALTAAGAVVGNNLDVPEPLGGGLGNRDAVGPNALAHGDASYAALTAAPGDETGPRDEQPPDLNAWPEESVWAAAVERFINPVVEALFGENFRAETAKALIKDYPWRQSYLQEVWSRLKLWPVHAWEDLRPEIAEGLAEGEGHREIRARIGRMLGIDAPTRKIEANINALTKTIENPDTSPGIRREARARRAALYRAKDREESRWWFYAARIARTETLGALNGGTYYGAKAFAEITGEEKYKQWWCLHPEMVVQARGVTEVARRHHNGDMIHIGTKGGALLMVTPSHPVLTVTGWTLAGELEPGARLVRMPHGPAGHPIGEIVQACLDRHAERGDMRTITRAHDEVQVCHADPDLIGPIIPAEHEPLSDLAAHVNEHRLPDAVTANLAVTSVRRARRSQWGAAAIAVDRLALDEVTSIDRSPYHGPVFDLVTRCGYFSANGLIVHNSTTDDRVRDSHWVAHMQVQPLAEKFKVGGHLLDHPGDPDGPGWEVINCRCSLLTMGKDEADHQRALYEAMRADRTDRQGRLLDEDGRPVVASAGPQEGNMPAKIKMGQVAKRAYEAGVVTAATAAEAVTEPAPGTSLPWRGVLAPLGHVSSDYRRIDPPAGGTLLTRDLPLPLLFQESLQPGHGDAVQGMANIRRAWIDTVAAAREMGLIPESSTLDDDTQLLLGEGNFDAADPEAVKLASKVRDQFLRFVSVDLDKVGEPAFRVYRDGEDVGELELDDDLFFLECEGLATNEGLARQFGIHVENTTVVQCDRPWSVAEHVARQLGYRELFHALRASAEFRARFGVEIADGDEIVEVIDEWRLMSTTMVSQPAFPEAFIVMVDAAEAEDAQPLAASAAIPSPRLSRDAALVAAANSWAHRTAAYAAESLHEPPAEFFANPNLTRPTNPTVTEQGRVFGHVHDWTTAHIGYSGRKVRAPQSKNDYSFFNLKPVRCADGSNIRCGSLVISVDPNTPGHAGLGMNTNQATDHYDNACKRVARIRVGRDEFGTWFSGALVPGVTPEQVLAIAELTCSGDWREGELRAALLVNVPGLPIVEGQDNTEPTALVAAGMILREEWGIAELDPQEPGNETLVAEVAAAVVAALDVRDADRAAAEIAAREEAERTVMLASLVSRSRSGGVQLLAERVYGRRAARIVSRVDGARVRQGA